MKDITQLTPESFSLTVQETIREFADGDHLLLRVAVAGAHFRHRNAAPFVRIVRADGSTVDALMTVVSADQNELRGYFPVDTEVTGRVEFGYTGQPMGSVPVTRLEIGRLEPKRVGAKVHRVTRQDPGIFKAASTTSVSAGEPQRADH